MSTDAAEVMTEHAHHTGNDRRGCYARGIDRRQQGDPRCTTYLLAAQIEAVRRLHPRSPDGDFCETCYPAGWSPAWDQATYPCPTAAALGITKDAEVLA